MPKNILKKQPYAGYDKMTIFWSACGILLIVISFFIYTAYPSGDDVKLVIDFGDGNNRDFVTKHSPGFKAWDLLQQANAVYGIPLEIEGNFKPRAIGGRKNGEGGKYWNFYINGERVDGSPFDSPLSGGDIILFKFEK